MKVQKHMENGLESYFLLKTRNSSSFRKDLHMVFLCFPSMRNSFTNALISIIQMMRADIGVELPIPEGMELSFSDKDTKWGSFKEYRK